MSGKRDKIKDKDRFSILTPGFKRCYVCGTTEDLHIHEVFGGANRAKSKEWGLTVSLCGYHHNLSKSGIHFNKELDNIVKQQAERYWMMEYCDDNLSDEEKIEKFIEVFGKNYID